MAELYDSAPLWVLTQVRAIPAFRRFMGPLDAFWHFSNFFAPAVGLGVIASLLAKLVWRRALAGVALRRLCAFSIGAGAAVLLLCLAAFGHDGTMATYTLMVLACAAALWWAGLRRLD